MKRGIVGRILCLDYGRRRIGVAISDPLGITAQPVTTWEGLTWTEAVSQVCVLIEQRDVVEIVVGLPLTLKGDKGKMAKEVERFADGLKERCRIPVQVWDERLTSIQARRILHQGKEKASTMRGKVDQVASVLLLQSYLDFQKGFMDNHQKEGG